MSFKEIFDGVSAVAALAAACAWFRAARAPLPIINFPDYCDREAMGEAARRRGDLVLDALLAHLAPLGWQHINLTGDYLWNEDSNLGPDGFRHLRGLQAEQLAALAG
jgi:hypothetical protein